MVMRQQQRSAVGVESSAWLRFPLVAAICATALLVAACGSNTGSDAQLSGALLFSYHCAACHGEQADGSGPVAQVLSVDVPNLRTLSQRSGGTFPRDAVAAYIDGRNLPVAHGDRYMPIWGNVLSWEAGSSLGAEEADTGDERQAQSEEAVRARIDAIVGFLADIQYSD